MRKKISKTNIVVGLTGGIASGKSTVTGVLHELGCTIIDADKIAREIVMPGQPAWQEIIARFGTGILLDNQQLDRKKLSEIIFNNNAAKKALDSISHPIILAEMQRKTREIVKKNDKVTIWDVPLLFEAQFAQYVDVSILVYTPVEIQLERLMKRDSLDREMALKRINAQMTLQQKKELATIIIDNSSNMEEVRKNVSLVYYKLITYLKD